MLLLKHQIKLIPWKLVFALVNLRRNILGIMATLPDANGLADVVFVH